MHTTHDDNATTWRDLADQLTPEQIARFERTEQLCETDAHKAFPQAGRAETAAEILGSMLAEARWEAQQNLQDKMFDVPVPAGAEEVYHWEDDGTNTWTRSVYGEHRVVEGFDGAVYRDGVQYLDGTVKWSLYIRACDSDDLTGDQVRQFAANLAEAADELDALQ